MRKTYIIGGGVALLLIIGVTIFLARDSSTPPTTENPEGLFPSGEATTTQATPPATQNTQDRTNSIKPVPVSSRLQPITRVGVAGFVVLETKEASSTLLRYAESDTGHLYEYTNNNTTRISNTTIPGIKEALWANSGEYVALRYLDGKANVIKTFVAHVGKISTTTLDGKFIEDDIKTVVVAPRERTAAEKFLTLTQKDGQSVGADFDTRNFDGARKARLFSSAVPEWHVNWPTSGILYFTTSPSGTANGYTYLYDLGRSGVTGDSGLVKILGPLSGLTSVASPDANTVLFSHTQGDKLLTKLYNTRTETSISLGIATIADKCVFSSKKMLYCAVPFFLPSATYPDDWYKGTVTFSDILWEIDAETGAGKVLVYPEREAGASIDAINLSTNPSGTMLYFTDKTTGILWRFPIE